MAQFASLIQRTVSIILAFVIQMLSAIKKRDVVSAHEVGYPYILLQYLMDPNPGKKREDKIE